MAGRHRRKSPFVAFVSRPASEHVVRAVAFMQRPVRAHWLYGVTMLTLASMGANFAVLLR